MLTLKTLLCFCPSIAGMRMSLLLQMQFGSEAQGCSSFKIIVIDSHQRYLSVTKFQITLPIIAEYCFLLLYTIMRVCQMVIFYNLLSNR